jgi:hypothetical protein
MKTIFIGEHVVPGKRLGRHIRHDPLSRNFTFVPKMTGGPLKEVHHRRYGLPFDQGQIGSCTGNAVAGICNTAPVHIPRHRLLTEEDAVKIYSRATQLDAWDGQYPPNDTGSDGLSAAKAAAEMGLITAYHWAFGIDQALLALQEKPFVTGTYWKEGMDEPDEHGFVKPTGQVRGGHEYECLGYLPRHDPLDSILVFENSWSLEYGKRGRFYMRVRDYGDLLEQDGDVTIFS